MQTIITFIEANFTKEIATILLSMVPIIELRGAIPLGMGLGLTYSKSLILSIIGASIPPIFIIFLIEYVFKLLRRFDFFDKLITNINLKTLTKKDKINKYGYLGLMLFVGIPLPGTGAWTGTLLAVLMNLNKAKSLIAIFAGNILAGLIVATISGGIFSLF